MAATWYHTVNGEMIGETTSGSRTSYLTDALGSVTATQNAAGTTTATWRYKSYGSLLAKTGGGLNPRFLWTGAIGSGHNDLDVAEQYTRARHYGSGAACWISVDPLWPLQRPYVYTSANPTSRIDPFGKEETCKYSPPPDDPNKNYGIFARFVTHAAGFMSASATVTLPKTCAAPKRGYFTFYLAFKVGDSSLVECGVKYKAPEKIGDECWFHFSRRQGSLNLNELVCDRCGPGADIKVTSSASQMSVRCQVKPSYDVSLDIKLPARRELEQVIGAGDVTHNHSLASWSGMTVNGAKYAPGKGDDCECRGDYCSRGVMRKYGIAAYLHWSSETGPSCECPEKVGVIGPG